MGQGFISDSNSERSLTKVLLNRMHVHQVRVMTRSGAIHSLQRLSIPFSRLNLSSATLACGVLFSCCRAMKCFGGHMTKIIEFYVPQSFRKASKWFPPVERGKVLAFPLAVRKSA